MGQQEASVDAVTVRAVGHRFDETAHLIEAAVRTHFGGLAFDGAVAGRAYVGEGDAIRFALHQLGAILLQWSRASAEVGSVLQISADRYAEADHHAAIGIG